MKRDQQTTHDEPTRFKLTRRGFVGGAAAAAAAVAAGAPGLAGAAPGTRRTSRLSAQEDGPSILIGTLGEAASINPFDSEDSEGDWRCKMLFDEFVGVTVDTYVPTPGLGLAKDWTVDNLTFVFTIHENAKFSDGTDLTADDVAFTITGMVNKEVASSYGGKFLVIAGAQEYYDGTAQEISGIRVIDPKTLEITLAQPDAPFLFNLRYIHPVPKALLDGKDLINDPFFQNPVGAGPFVFESWTTDADFVATRNPHYWQEGKPALARLTHRVIADSNSLVLALQTGEIDASNYPNPAAKGDLEENPDLTVMVPPFTSPDGWQFNFANEWLAKKEVRRAIAMSLDMKQFAADSLFGLGAEGVGPIAPGSWAYDPDLQPIPFDPEGALALVQSVGLPQGTEIRFMVNQGNILREDFLIYTQQQLEPLGIAVVPEVIEYATLLERVQAKDYDVNGVVFTGVTAEPSELSEQFSTNGSGNFSNYSNQQLDELLAQAKAELDTEVAKGIYKEIQVILMDDLPTFQAWYRPFLHTVKKTFTGYTDSAAYGLFHTLENWTVTE